MHTLLERLLAYEQSDYYGFHMPGHKRNTSMLGALLPYGIDITEIEGFDDLNHPTGILKEACKRATKLYDCEETFFLINGSTAGILSGIRAVVNQGEQILVARNCHKSVFNGIDLFELKPVYIYPQPAMLQPKGVEADFAGEISPRDVECALNKHPNIKAMVMVSPTYEGVVSDIPAICRILHKRKIPLILDAAHGAHFGFHPIFPQNGNQQQGDIVIHSLHKTMPSLTQTGLIHVNGEIVDKQQVEAALSMLQSSSPSYVLMASIDRCIRMMEGEKGRKMMTEYADRLINLRHKLEQLKHLKLLETAHYDKSKLLISTEGTNIASYALYHKLLNQYHLQMEMFSGGYVMGMTTMCDTNEGFHRLDTALHEIDAGLSSTRRDSKKETWSKIVKPLLGEQERVYESYEIRGKKTVNVLSKEALGRVCATTLYAYPPGIPLIIPGERVSLALINVIQWYQDEGISIEGIHGGCMKVLSGE